jgi:hypothetical protein
MHFSVCSVNVGPATDQTRQNFHNVIKVSPRQTTPKTSHPRVNGSSAAAGAVLFWPVAGSKHATDRTAAVFNFANALRGVMVFTPGLIAGHLARPASITDQSGTTGRRRGLHRNG